MFCCARCGIRGDENSPTVPASGFKITERIDKDAAGKHWVHVTKEGNANNSVSAGTSTDDRKKDVEIKD